MIDVAIDVETAQADYITETLALNAPPVYRVSIPSVKGRYYVTFEPETNKPILLTSGTTIIADGFANPEKVNILSRWRATEILNGRDPDETVKYRQDYGTIMHTLFGDILKKKTVPIGFGEGGLNRLESYIRNLNLKISDKSLDYILDNYIVELQKDLLAFIKWVKDYNVKPLAIELMVFLLKYRVGSAIDLICEMDWEEEGYFGEVYKTNTAAHKKGDPKLSKRKTRILAIVDFKSGKKGFFEEYILQLLLYKNTLAETYNIHIEHIFNFAPKDWKVSTGASYTLTRQDFKAVSSYYEDVMNLGYRRFLEKKTSFNIFTGDISLDPDNNTAKIIEVDLMLELYKKYSPDFVEEYLSKVKDETN